MRASRPTAIQRPVDRMTRMRKGLAKSPCDRCSRIECNCCRPNCGNSDLPRNIAALVHPHQDVRYQRRFDVLTDRGIPYHFFDHKLRRDAADSSMGSVPRALSAGSLTQDDAARLFFNDYVVDRSVISSGLFAYIPDIYAKSPTGSALSKTISAVGLASFSNDKRDPQILKAAAGKYAAALRSIYAALADPIHARYDETLMTVLLLALYEEVC